jgi:hypothetical protein
MLFSPRTARGCIPRCVYQRQRPRGPRCSESVPLSLAEKGVHVRCVPPTGKELKNLDAVEPKRSPPEPDARAMARAPILP